MIKTKSVHSPIERQDGLRILAARLRGRGLPASRYDVWMANLGPSEALLRDFLAKRTSWPEFSRRYRKELMESGGVRCPQQDYQEPRAEVHAAADTDPGAGRQRHADVPLRRG